MRGTNRPWMYGEDITPFEMIDSGYIKASKTCAAEGCTRRRPRCSGRVEKTRGKLRKYCHAHAMHLRRHGETRPIGRTFNARPQADVDRAWYLHTHGCTYIQIAKAMATSTHAVCKMLERARKSGATGYHKVFTPEQIRDIKAAVAAGATRVSQAIKYGVAYTTVKKLCSTSS